MSKLPHPLDSKTPEAISKAIEGIRWYIVSVARMQGVRSAHLDDAVQEVSILLWRKWDKFENIPQYQLAIKNRVISFLRSKYNRASSHECALRDTDSYIHDYDSEFLLDALWERQCEAVDAALLESRELSLEEWQKLKQLTFELI